MFRRFIYILLTLMSIGWSLAEESDFSRGSQDSKTHFVQPDRLLANMIRGKNSSKVFDRNRNDSEAKDEFNEKRGRTSFHGSPGSEGRDNCCGGSYGLNASGRGDPYQKRLPADGGRQATQYTPVDRYGWQTHIRPPTSSGINTRPGSGNYAGTYSGSATYGGSHAGDRFSTRPTFGSEYYGKPGNYGAGGYGYGSGSYGGYTSGRPTSQGGSGSYGISGTLADGEEFGPGEPNFPEGNPPSPHPSIQAQKAVALKALAGVALIGAAAALAANPVLLPIGLITGRRKRSEVYTRDDDVQTEHIIKLLKTYFPKVISMNGVGGKLLISPRCVARLTCEIQRSYLTDIDKEVEVLKEDKNAKYRLSNLIRINLLNAESINGNLKNLIRAGALVATSSKTCNIFQCNFVKVGR